MMTSASCGANGATRISQSTRKESKSGMHRIISPTIVIAPTKRKIEIWSSDANQPRLKFVVKCREAAKRSEEEFPDYRIPKKPTQRKRWKR